MMYFLIFTPLVDKKIRRLKKKNFGRYLILKKKLSEIAEFPAEYKKLRRKMFGLQRVHIDKHFVLTFRIDHKKKEITVEDIDHHDNIYK